MARFEGRTVVVTGGGSGIGFEMARLFLEDGARVFAADVHADSVPEGATPVHVDVANEADVKSLIDLAASSDGSIDVLCNNAGVGSSTDPVECSVEEWDRVFAVNSRGVFLGIKHALAYMLPRRSGAIVNTASVAGLVGFKDRTAYCASKGAVIALTRQVALQYAAFGIRCNCICPGTIDSPWIEDLLAKEADPETARRSLIERQPMGRLGIPAEIAKAALYLASDEAAFITGTALVIDGGLTSR